ncbi:NUDT2.2 family protein [Megaselia abdita]
MVQWIAGVIIFRLSDDNIEYLLVNGAEGFAPPEGHVTEEESPLMRVTAINKVTSMFDRTDLEIPAIDSIVVEEDDIKRNYYIGRLHNGLKPPVLENDSKYEWLVLNDVIESLDNHHVIAAFRNAQNIIESIYNVE